MNPHFIKLFLVALSVTLISACGKTSAQKAKSANDAFSQAVAFEAKGNALFKQGKGTFDDDEAVLLRALNAYEESWLCIMKEEYPGGTLFSDEAKWRSLRNRLVQKIKESASEAYPDYNLPERDTKDLPSLNPF